MKIIVNVYRNQAQAAEAAKLDVHLMGGELRMKPYIVRKSQKEENMYISQSQIRDRIVGLEISAWFSHYNVNLTAEEREFLDSRKRG